ncbi:methylation-associated defense system restriction endonuclease subunit S MAD5 [Streptomyces sp. NPDC054864]
MKVAELSNPVKSDWFADQGLRLDASPYVAGSMKTKKLLEQLPRTEPLASLTAGYKSGIFSGPMFRRVFLTDPEHSVPFIGTKDMMAADLTGLPRLRKSDAESSALSYLQLKPGMTLISRSGFNAGRRAYVRPDMGDYWASEDIVKVEPDPEKIKSGYLYTFLLSKFGESLVRGSVYGSAVKHIEPHHIAGLPVPRLGTTLEGQIHDLVDECARLRAEFQSASVSATKDLFTSVGLPELNDVGWHQQERDLGFKVEGLSSDSLRALNFSPRAKNLAQQLSLVPGESFGNVCTESSLKIGSRFKRIDVDSAHGVRLLGQRQVFWLRPEGRWISAAQAPSNSSLPDETILIAGRGTLGENEVYGRAIFVTGSWLTNAYSQDFVRVSSGNPDIPGAYLFAFFRSTVAFRLLRSMSYGGKQQGFLPSKLQELRIPLAPPADRKRIAATVRHAYKCRDQADVLEDRALALLTTAIEEAAG